MAVLVPTTLEEALAALTRAPGAALLAGGTDLMVDVNEDRRRPDDVICVRDLDALRGWTVEDDMLVVGAAVTYTELLDPRLAAYAPALAAAARTVGSPQIRNAGTIGGNVATASPAGDTLPVLLALGASVAVIGRDGGRDVPLREFLVGPKRTALAAGELVTAIRVPIRRGPQDYLKVGTRNAMVIAVASVALSVDFDAHRVGIGLGSVGPTPLTADSAAAWLAGRLAWSEGAIAVSDPSDLDGFARRVAAEVHAIDDHRSTARYREHAVEVLARRALRRSLA